jgi:hypothetical protein
MKREWDLIRLLLLRLEAEETANAHLAPQAMGGFDAELVGYHIDLLDQAGLLTARRAGDTIVARRLTWDGHELLDSIRRDTVWNRAKGILREKGLDLTLDALRLAVKAAIEAAF